MYVIRDWSRLYELPAATAGASASGKLRFVRWRVHAHRWTSDYLRLRRQIGEEGLAAALGVFGKLLEMAAAEPRERRNGTVYNERHEPASLDDVAEENGFPRTQTEACVHALLESGWLEKREALPRATPSTVAPARDDSRPVADHRGASRTAASDRGLSQPVVQSRDSSRPVAKPRGPSRSVADDRDPSRSVAERRLPSRSVAALRAETEPEPEQNGTEISETGRMMNVVRRKPDDAEGSAGSDFSPGGGSGSGSGCDGIAAAAVLRLSDLFGLNDQAVATASGLRAKQIRRDMTTLRRVVSHVVQQAPSGDARRQADSLIALAHEKLTSGLQRPLAGFVAAVKKRHGPWPELKES